MVDLASITAQASTDGLTFSSDAEKSCCLLRLDGADERAADRGLELLKTLEGKAETLRGVSLNSCWVYSLLSSFVSSSEISDALHTICGHDVCLMLYISC